MGGVNPIRKIVPPQAPEEPAGGGGDKSIQNDAPKAVVQEASFFEEISIAPIAIADLTPYARDLSLFLNTSQIPDPLRRTIVEAALLRSRQAGSQLIPSPPFSSLIVQFYSKPNPDREALGFQRFRWDPLQFESVDQYGALMAPYLHALMDDPDPDKGMPPPLIKSTRKFNLDNYQFLIGQSPELSSEEGGALPERWADFYYDSRIIPDPKIPDSPDGDLPYDLAWTPPLKVENSLDEGLYLAMEDQPSEKVKELRRWVGHDLREEAVYLGNKYQAQDQFFEGQVNGTGLTDVVELPEKPGYSDLTLPPVMDMIRREAELLEHDFLLEQASLKPLLPDPDFISSPMWNDINSALTLSEQEILGGSAACLVPLPADYLQVTTDGLAGYFHTLWSFIVLETRQSSSLSALAALLKARVQRGLDQTVSPESRPWFSLQTATFLQVILDAFQRTDGAINDERHRAYLDSVKLLLHNFIEALKGENVEDSVYVRHALDGVAHVYDLLGQIEKTSALSINPKENLLAWPTYQNYKMMVREANPSQEYGGPLLQLLEQDQDSASFFQAMELKTDVSVMKNLTSESWLFTIDNLEAEALDYLRPEQAVSFVNRLRYAIYYFKYRVHKEATAKIRSDPTTFLSLSPEQVRAHSKITSDLIV